jgi:hypothetical protein
MFFLGLLVVYGPYDCVYVEKSEVARVSWFAYLGWIRPFLNNNNNNVSISFVYAWYLALNEFIH